MEGAFKQNNMYSVPPKLNFCNSKFQQFKFYISKLSNGKISQAENHFNGYKNTNKY